MTKKEEDYIRQELIKYYQDSRFQKMDRFIQHGNVTCLRHCISVAYFSYAYCVKHHIRADYESLIRGAMLHDYFLYDWHRKESKRKLHGLYHPVQALENAERDFGLTNVERDMIVNHMWPLTFFRIPHFKESWVVCMIDKLCSLSETFGNDIWQYSLVGI